MTEASGPRDTGPRPVAASLDRLSRSLGGPAAAVLEQVFSDWPDLVGASLASHVEPLSLRAGVLVVGVDDPAWGTELRYRSAELVARISSRVGPGAPVRIEVRVRPASTQRSGPPVVE